jgi:AcrR family transcriptional regulator
MSSAARPSGRHKALRPHDPDKRAAILEAALDLFVERGFHGTAVPAIAERAGVGAGTIYRYFESKEALVNALYREWKQAISTSVISRMPVGRPPREQFRAVFERMCEFVAEHPKVYAFLELHHHAPYLDEDNRATEQGIYDFAEAFVRDAQRRGIVREAPPAVLLALMHGAFVGLVRFCREGRVPWQPAELAAAEQALWDLVSAS